MDFSNTDFDYQNAQNAYPPTSPIFAVFSPIFRLFFVNMDLHGLVMEKSWNFIVL